MSTLLKCYDRLLTDVSNLSGVALRAPDGLGMAWVTKGGPALDKRLLQYLDVEDSLSPSDLSLELPEWLSPLWNLYLLTKDPGYIRMLRQVLVFGYKAEFEPTSQQLEEATASFVTTDQQVGEFESHIDFNKPFWRTARAIVSRIIGDIDWTRILPKHGPGSVYPSFDPSVRSDFDTIHETIETYYPFWDFFWGLPRFTPRTPQELDQADIKESSSPLQGKLVFVPKDSRGPRTICVHPKESIWIQQGLRVPLELAAVRRTAERINFADQSINGLLALRSSQDRAYYTLDLKDASDRLGCRVVRFLLGDHAYDRLSCTRVAEVILPDKRVISLNKWAPMGNALCFPVESIMFYALARAGVEVRYGSNAKPDIHVFGDDIIGRSEYLSASIMGLERAGLSVNRSKTFGRGFFRESCGVDAFRGVDVTPLRMKTHAVRSATDLVSLCELAKNLRMQGYEETASCVFAYVRRVWRGCDIPITNNPDVSGAVEYLDKPVQTIIEYNLPYTRKGKRGKRLPITRWNDGLHRYEVWIGRVQATTACIQDDRYHLLDSLLSLERRAVASDVVSNDDVLNGVSYPIPHRSRLKEGWSELLYK